MSLLGDRLRRVFVNDRPVDVPANTRGADIIEAAGQDPSRHTLMTSGPGGKPQVLPGERRIEPVNGQQYETVLPAVGGFV